MTWQDEITSEQWEDWQKYARKISKSKKVNTTLGPEDYAATAIEKLLMQAKKPDNVEGWIALTIKNQYIDRFRKIQARGGASMRKGVFAGIVPWIMGGLYFWVSTSNIADSIPVYAQFGFLLTFLFFNSFAINMWLQYKKIGKWKVYAYGEKAYIVLSLVSKSALGWIVVLGSLGI